MQQKSEIYFAYAEIIMGVSNGLTLLEGETTKAAQGKTSFSDHRQLSHYLSLLCFLLTIVTLLQTLCLVQILLTSQSQSSLQENKLQELRKRLEKLDQSHHLLFAQYPALNQYCPINSSSTGERKCRPCLIDWTLQGEKCFYFSEDRADWISSQYLCMSLGGAVATIKTEEEQEFLFKMAQSRSQGDSFWFGLRSSAVDRTWQWSDGTPLEDGPQSHPVCSCAADRPYRNPPVNMLSMGHRQNMLRMLVGRFWEHEPDVTGEKREVCGRLTPGDNYRKSWFSSSCSGQLRRICERRQASLQ